MRQPPVFAAAVIHILRSYGVSRRSLSGRRSCRIVCEEQREGNRPATKMNTGVVVLPLPTLVYSASKRLIVSQFVDGTLAVHQPQPRAHSSQGRPLSNRFAPRAHPLSSESAHDDYSRNWICWKTKLRCSSWSGRCVCCLLSPVHTNCSNCT